MTLSPGAKLGPYEIVGPAGSGGMGQVFKARDTRLHRIVAIKVLPPERLTDPAAKRRFEREARAIAALSHPYICALFDIGHQDGVDFLVMEFLEGETLGARLSRGSLALDKAVQYTIQIAEALGAAHQVGIIHRDIKPSNVMIRPDGYVQVLDFGVAVLRSEMTHAGATATTDAMNTIGNSAVGTPAYMSPEQIEGAIVDQRTDIFSLGVLLCEAATGAHPFAGHSVLETISAIGRTPGRANELTRALPEPVRNVVLKALQKEPGQRYQSCAEMIESLKAVALSFSGTAVAAKPRRRQTALIATAAITLLLALAVGTFTYRRMDRVRWVQQQAIPAIKKLVESDHGTEALKLIATAEGYLPNDASLKQATQDATQTVAVLSSPAGATVQIQDYLFPDDSWVSLGVTPLEHARVPRGYLRWKVAKQGIGELVAAPRTTDTLDFDLATAAIAPKGMVPIPGTTWQNYLAFLGWVGPYKLPPSYIDQFEVTNQQYQDFVDHGGYRRRELWNEPFVKDGRSLDWADAMRLFVDTTGRPGPSTWEGGHYPEGKADFPVSGVSWYEAAAYANFVGKSLPVIAQGYEAAPMDVDRYAVRLSNLTDQAMRVGQSKALGVHGTYDLVGNLREWYWNATDDGLRFTLGRMPSAYGPEALSAFDRSALDGFRCVLNNAALSPELLAPRSFFHRDFDHVQPATDDVFKVYRSMYAYDRTPLDASVSPNPERHADWTRQTVTFNAAYGRERMRAFLFLPARVRPPYQVVVFFPSARVNFLTSSDQLGDMRFVDYVVKSGRAVMYPVYQSLYERRSTASVLPGPTLHRDIIISWSKDLGRSIDYLETREDIDKTRIGYLGVSQGTAYGVILAALEDRFKAIVFLDGGFFQGDNPTAGMDQADFAPRITKPVLMVNGRYDASFPYQTAQLPLFRALGSRPDDKRHVVFETPHDVSQKRSELIHEVLNWYDKYLGMIDGPAAHQ
jgi:eukaryotic-like serine/threonine-protein kinase